MIEKVIPLLFCGLAAMLAPGAEETHAMLIADFDTPADAARFVPMKDNANRMTFNDQPEFIVSGTGSGRFYVPKAGTGEHRWPRVTLNLPADRQDWSAYDTLEMDIVNPLATEGRLGLNLYDSDGKSYPYYTQPVPPGRSQFVWKFPDAVRDHRITRLMLTVSDPVTEYTLYLDNIRATVSRSSLNARIEWQRKRLRADWPESEWRRGGMADDFAALDRRLKQLQTGDRPLPESLAEYAAIRADYLKKKQELIARLCRSAAEEFDRVWPAPAVWGYGWTGGTQKVYRADLPYQGKIGGTPEVALARREREGVQIVLRSRRKLADVRVQVGNLTNPATGAILPAQQIAVLPVGHVKTSTPPYPADPATWRPDPLLGFLKSFELDSDVWQAVWLDVSATAATPPGDYRGTVTITADGAPELRIPLTVKVWSFALPEAMTQPQLFNYCSNRQRREAGTVAQIHIGAGGDQFPQTLRRRIEQQRDMQCRGAGAIGQIDLDLRLGQEFMINRGRGVDLGQENQHRIAILVLRIDVGAPLQQHGRRRPFLFRRRQMQRRMLMIIDGIDRHSQIQQAADHRQIGRGCGIMQRRPLMIVCFRRRQRIAGFLQQIERIRIFPDIGDKNRGFPGEILIFPIPEMPPEHFPHDRNITALVLAGDLKRIPGAFPSATLAIMLRPEIKLPAPGQIE